MGPAPASLALTTLVLGACSLTLDVASLKSGCKTGEVKRDGRCVGAPSEGQPDASSPESCGGRAHCDAGASDASSVPLDGGGRPDDGGPDPNDASDLADAGHDGGPHEPPCEASCVNPDAAHCDVVCDEHRACVVVPRDRDGDRHGDMLCKRAAVAGDDCNDDDQHSFPGAPESCDGRDNNCNGHTDLEDGLPLSGQVAPLAEDVSDVALAAHDSGFGVVFTRSPDVWFRALTAEGTPEGFEKLVSRADETDDPNTRIALAWGGDSFGLSVARFTGTRFLELTATGNPGDEVDTTAYAFKEAGYTQVARVFPKDWLVFYTGVNQGFVGLRINALGTVRPPRPIGDHHVLMPSVSVAGAQVGLAWTQLNRADETLSIHAQRFTDDLTPMGHDEPLVLAPKSGWVGGAVVAASPRGYGLAWTGKDPNSEAPLARFVELDEEGYVRCEISDIDAESTPGLFTPRDILTTEDGYYVIGTSDTGGGALELLDVQVRSDRSCSLRQRVQIVDYVEGGARFARSGSGHLVIVWDAGPEQATTVLFRALAPTLCSSAKPDAER